MFQRRERPGAESLTLGLQLLEQVQARFLFCLVPNQSVQRQGRGLHFLLKLLQPPLPLFNGTAPGLNVQLFRFDIRGKFAQPLLQPRALLFQLDFLGGKFFHSNHIALLLQIQRIHFVADPRELLGGGENLRLHLPQELLLPG